MVDDFSPPLKTIIVGIALFFLMIRRPPTSTQSRSSAASDVYKRQVQTLRVPCHPIWAYVGWVGLSALSAAAANPKVMTTEMTLSMLAVIKTPMLKASTMGGPPYPAVSRYEFAISPSVDWTEG